MKQRKVRTLFMSDFHVGYKGFDAPAATHCLQTHDCEMLYLLGDIFDGWKLEKRWYWNADYTELFDTLVDKQKQGVKIFYTPGNHDEKMRWMLRNPFDNFMGDIRQNAKIIALRGHLRIKYGVRIDNHYTHKTQDGKKYLVLHGDQFDSRVIEKISKPVDRIYDFLVDREILPPRKVDIENTDNHRFSMGKAIAVSGTSYLSNRLKKAAYKRVKNDFDGIIFGHTHNAMHEDYKGVLIANTGSFTLKEDRATHHTAIVENVDGAMEPIKIPMMRRAKNHPNKTCIDAFQMQSRHKETRQIAHFAHDLWCAPRKAQLMVPKLAA